MEEKTFNARQRQVIEAVGGRHLVLAPPGCGKTAVLAERIVWARRHGVPFSEMACLTFTNRAARGMHERIEQRLGDAEGIDELFVGNVHRFCSHFLFDSGIVPEQSVVIDTETSISILADFLGDDELRVIGDGTLMKRYSQIINLQHMLYQCARDYPRELIIHREDLDARLLKELCLTFGLEYTQESTLEIYANADYYQEKHFLLSREANNLLDMISTARKYELYKQRNDLLDFEDLLLFAYDAMPLHQPMRKLRWVQIDEVQDLNPLQLAIIDRCCSDDATVVYLGDAQQAIFSFMGAKTDTLSKLQQRCGEGHLYNFHENYRSPDYLLNVYNTYARCQLGIAPELLPTTTDSTAHTEGDLQLQCAYTQAEEAGMVASMVKQLMREHPDETIAVVVAFNSDADEVSTALLGVPHFKVSGADVFSSSTMRTLLAHFSVLSMEHNFIAWSQLFTGLRLFATNSGSRHFVRGMMDVGLTATDFIEYRGRATYLSQFVETYEHCDIVVFDTETTGLSVMDDDVVQLAAVKVRHGRVTGELNIFMATDRELPAMLGDVPNPLIDEYARHSHLSHREGLEQFVAFARGCAIIGHNATYDYQIMEHNMRRYAPELSMEREWPTYLDTLKLARLLHPRQKSYKLKNLLAQLGLEGENSHLANDDILATQSLMVHCYDLARTLTGRQMEFISRHRKTVERFYNIYSDIYNHGKALLYDDGDSQVLATEMEAVYDSLVNGMRLEPLAKFAYIIKYVKHELLDGQSGRTLAEQLHRHINDLCTMKEADLCGSASMTDKVFVSTVHKAKGLEFDNVIVYDVVDGKYPSTFAKNRKGGYDEEARKLYVAMSRARRRLILTYCQQCVSPWGRTYLRLPSPYLQHVKKMFTQ